MKLLWCSLVFVLCSSNLFAQDRYSFSWGYNRATFRPTDVRFKSEEGQFTIHSAKGYDRPTPFSFKEYFALDKISIPQYNYKFTYRPNDNYTVIVGLDHMKWVFDNSKTYKVTGSYTAKIFDHNGQELDWNSDVLQKGNTRFINMEHTDGYNFAYLGLEKSFKLLESRNKKMGLSLNAGGSIGPMIPRTMVGMHRDAAWNTEVQNNKFHVAGFGVNAALGARAHFHRFFLEASAKLIYVDIINALASTSSAHPASLSHEMVNGELILSAGVNFGGKKKKK
jgi:hypothetical protein